MNPDPPKLQRSGWVYFEDQFHGSSETLEILLLNIVCKQ